jgi:HSP20 family molecular chaperone IbpA
VKSRAEDLINQARAPPARTTISKQPFQLTLNRQQPTITMAFFDDFDRQLLDMMRTFDHYAPMFGRTEPPMMDGNSSGNGSSTVATRGTRQFPFLRTRMDLVETPKSYKVVMELPGVNKEDIKVSVDDNVLSVQAEQRE